MSWRCALRFSCRFSVLMFCLIVLFFLPATGRGEGKSITLQHKRYKILHVMSYHSPWRWTDGQLQGFKDGLGDVPVEYKIFQMDTKHNSTPAAKIRAGDAARELIDRWQPDLLYTTDDDAQQYVAKHYLNRDLPIVFSGVNKDPEVYGFEGSNNVTGVMEQEHFAESVQLLKKLVPGVKRIAVVFDDAPMWKPVKERMRAALPQIADVESGPWDIIDSFEQYKARIRTYHGQVDAIALIGVFHFKDAQGQNVPYREVLRWTAEHSSLPDLGFWIDRMHFGTLCGVTVSGREQGLSAGRLARAILVEGKSPSSLPMQPTVKGLPVISLSRAQKLGLRPNTSVLLSSEVVQQFEWEKE